MKITYLILIASILTSFSVHAEVYKWTDKHGNVHYTDRSVKDSREMNVYTEDDKEKKVRTEDRTEQRRKLVDAMEEDRKEKEKLKKQEQKRKKNLKRKCQWAKDQLRGYETASGIYNLDKDGKRVILSDKERSKSTNRLRADIKKHCK